MIVGVCRLIANHLHLACFESIPEVRVLPSTGITRLQRSYYPVRLPPMPPPEATFEATTLAPNGSPPDYPNHLFGRAVPAGSLSRPQATFVTPTRAARQLPDQLTTLRVDSSSTDDSRLRGALPKPDSCIGARRSTIRSPRRPARAALPAAQARALCLSSG
jgi:hypothetical protein